jgi:hypothetical protein
MLLVSAFAAAVFVATTAPVVFADGAGPGT